MKRTLQLLAFAATCASVWMLSGQTASAAPRSTAEADPTVQFFVDGVRYAAQPGQELTVQLDGTAGSGADPRMVATAVHLKALGNRVSVAAPASLGGITPLITGCYASNGGKAWFTNVFGTTLGSYELDVSYSADTLADLVTNYSRYIDQWYANEGLAWYYNDRRDVNTEINRRDATAASTIHFTGPFFQTENTEVAVDMHGNCTSNNREYVFSGDIVIY